MRWVLLAAVVIALVGYWGMHRAAARRPSYQELTKGIDLTPYIINITADTEMFIVAMDDLAVTFRAFDMAVAEFQGVWVKLPAEEE